MNQRTIKQKVELTGIGLHKGVPVTMVLEPLEANSGVVFYRSDLGISIPIKPQNIINTTMATVIGYENARISTIEHLMSAIYAYGIDNIKVSVDNEEIPIMDGSAIAYCMLLDEAGIIEIDEPRKLIEIKKPIEVREGDKFVRLEPSPKTIFDFSIDFKHPAIREQSYKFTFSKKSYIEEIAKARTFGFLEEVNHLRSIGLAKGGNLNNCIVLDEQGIMNKDGLRYKEEFVRHKILDAIGDMAILGIPILGSYISFAGSHKLNSLLTQELLAQSDVYEVVSIEDSQKIKEFEKAIAIS